VISFKITSSSLYCTETHATKTIYSCLSGLSVAKQPLNVTDMSLHHWMDCFGATLFGNPASPWSLECFVCTWKGAMGSGVCIRAGEDREKREQKGEGANGEQHSPFPILLGGAHLECPAKLNQLSPAHCVAVCL
jgi:hypothetical protein